MPSRFVLDELDVDLPPLATRLVIIIVVVVGGSTDARTLDSSSISIAIASERVLSTRALVGVGILDVGHGRRWGTRLTSVAASLGWIWPNWV